MDGYISRALEELERSKEQLELISKRQLAINELEKKNAAFKGEINTLAENLNDRNRQIESFSAKMAAAEKRLEQLYGIHGLQENKHGSNTT